MTVFGIPRAHEDDALRAVRAATDLREALRELAAELERERGVGVAVRTGVSTGVVVAAGAGEGALRAGDVIRLGARLAQTAEPDEILVTPETERLLRGAAALEPAHNGSFRVVSVAPEAAPIPRRVDAPMVGRERELGQLRQAFDRAVRERTPYLFTILGPAGIGKSRLAIELARSLADNATVLAGRCLPYGEGITFWPLAEVVRQAAGDGTRENLAKLLGDVPDAELIADRVAGAIGLAEAAGAAEETFWAARKLFAALAAERPLVLVFDDLHWAEPTFLDLVEHVADWARDAPILIVCLARPELVEERHWWAGGKLNATSLLLDPLSELETDALIDSVLGERELSADARARVAEAAEGNPLFLEQMLLMLAEEDEPVRSLVVPPTIHALLEARLDRLDSAQRAVLEQASVIGKEFWRGALLALEQTAAPDEMVKNLDLLVRRELIRPSRSLFAGEDAYRFRHNLIREAAYSSVPKESRAELHERFADWLEAKSGRRGAEYEEIVGYHLEQACRYRLELDPRDPLARPVASRAAERLGAGGRRAYAVGDMPAALGLLTRAGELLEPGESGRLELLVDLADALRETGDFKRAQTVLDDVIEDAAGTAEVIEAHARVLRAAVQLQTDPRMPTDEILREAERAIAVFERAGAERQLAEAWRLRARAHLFRCRAADAQRAVERAVEYARRAGDRRIEAQSLNLAVGAAFLGPTPVPDAVRTCEQILRRPGEQRRVRASALRALAGLRAMEGRFDEARVLIADCRTILDDLGLRVTGATAAETAGAIELLAGDAEAAVRELRRGYGSLEQMGETDNLPVLAAMLAQALHALGQDDEALVMTELSEQIAARDDLAAQAQWRAARAKAVARAGRADDAEALARESVALAGSSDFLVLHGDTLADLAEVLTAAKRGDEAAVSLEEALGLYRRKGNAVAAATAAARLARLKGAQRCGGTCSILPKWGVWAAGARR